MKKIYCALFFLLLTGLGTVVAQNRYWVSGTASNWNNVNNWSATSGGAPGASVPGASNAVFFNASGLGNCNLDVAPTVAGISIVGYTGTIDLVGNNLTTTGTNTFTNGTISNTGAAAAVTLNTTVTTTFNGTLFNAAVNGSTGRLFFNGSTFNGTVSVIKTDNNTDTGTGANTFNNTLTVGNAGTAELRMGNTTADVFGGVVNININSTGDISLARTSAGNQFNQNIVVNYNALGDVFIGANGGSATLAAGRTITVGTIGASGSGDLSLARFTQTGGTAQNISLSGDNASTLTIGPSSSFSGSLTINVPSVILNSSTFQAFTLTKTGTQADNFRGGNIFNGLCTVNNQGGDVLFGTNIADAGDTWNANAVFNNTGGNRIRIAEQSAGSIFQADATFNNTSVTDVQSRIQIGRFNGGECTFNGTTTFNNSGVASDIHVSYEAGSSTTFNGPVIYINNASGGSEQYLGNDGNINFASSLSIVNNTSDIVYLTAGTGTATFGNGTITVGAFAAGSLRFRNFTQTGATAQTVALTGTASLYVGPASTFNGNVNFTAPQLYLNGCTYAGAAVLEKNGATDNYSTGGNIFNGTTTITNSSSGYIVLGNVNADQFNGVTTFNNTGSTRFYFGHNHTGQTTTFGNNLTLNTNKTGGADAWSFLINEGVSTNTTFGGNLTINCAGTLQSNHRILNGATTTATYNGLVTINLTNSHASTVIQMGTNGTSTYNQNIVVSNSGGASGINFNTGASSGSTLAATRTITIGGGGFTSGSLGLLRFTQVGATAQTLNSLTGTANLIVGPASAFGGDVDFRAPQIHLNGCTYSGTATIEKTGATDNAGLGGNTFSGVTTITNSGSGYLMTGNGTRDQFNATTTFNNTGSYRIYVAYTHPGQTTTFATNVTFNSNKTGGADPWSYLIGDVGATNVSFGGSTTFNCAGAVRSDHRLANGVGSTITYAGAVTINLSNSAATTITMGENGTSTYNGNISVSNSGGANGITFNNAATASSTLNGSITAGVFSGGTLNLYRFTQLGAFTQNITLTNTALMRVGPASSFAGDVNFISPRLLLDGCTYNGITYLEKNGANNDTGIGNNIFNGNTTIVNSGSAVLRTNGNNTFGGTTTITNSASADILLELVSGSTYSGDVTFNNTGSSNIRVAFQGTTAFNGNIIVNNPTGTGVTFCESASATATLADTRTITIGGSGFNAGTLSLPRFTQVGGTAQALALTGTGILTLGPSSTFNGNVNFSSPRLLLQGTTYNGTATLQKTSVTNDDGNGGNVFNSTATLINSGDNYLRTGGASPDTFNGLLTITNTGASTIRLADVVAGTQFNGNIELNSTFGGGIYFGNNGGSSTLAATRTISVGTSGVLSGDIRLIRFTQVGATAQTLDLSGIAILTLGPLSSFGGDINFKAPQLLMTTTTFTGAAYLEKEGAVDNASVGGNTFNGTTTIANSGSGYLLMANTTADIFNGNLTVTNTGSNIIYLAHNVGGNQFNGNITVNSTLGSGGIYFSNNVAGSATFGNGSLAVGGMGFVSGNLRFRRFTQLGTTAQNLTLTGTALLELGPTSTFNGTVDFRAPQFELDGCTFNGTTRLEKTGATNNDSNGGNFFNGATTIVNSGSGHFRFANTALDTFNGNVSLTNSGANAILMADVIAGTVFNGNIEVNSTSGIGIYFGDNPPANATLAPGRTITVGATGFTTGELRLDRFIQQGGTPQTLLLTGTATLTVGPGSQYNGNVDFRAPQLLLSGGTFNGTAFLEKNGAGGNQGNGGNVFNSTTTIQNTGSGVLRTNGGNTFNGTTTVINAGTADVLLELTTASTYNGDVTFTNTNSSNVRAAYIGANTFNGNITVNSTAGLGVYFCENAAGSATLSAGRTLSVGGTGFTAGELRLQRFTQTGATSQNIALTGASTFRSGPTVVWNGDVTFSSPILFLDGSTLNGATNNITKTGTTTDNSVGANIFNGNTTFTNSGTGNFRFAVTTADTYNGNVTFVRANGTIQPAYNNTTTVNGNIHTNSTTTITFGANTGGIAFSGAAAQTVNRVAGASPTFTRMTMSKSGGDLTLNTDVTVSVSATFTTGIVNTTGTNYLNFADNAISIGGADASYVDGPVRKTGNDAFTFPIGDNNFYRPASISAPTGTAHYFTAQYFRTNHNLGSPAVWDPSFYTVSGCEYWTIDRNTAPTSNVSVTLSWNESACNAGYVTNPADLRVARWSGTNWVNHGNGGTTGTATNGTIISSAAVTSFSPFTLASVSFANPLPIELATFTATVQSDNTVKLDWHTDSELNNARFDVERSKDGFDFQSIGSRSGAGTTNEGHDYFFIDEQPYNGTSYYRLKQTDFDGTSTYSRFVMAIVNQPDEPFAIHPNPARNQWVTFNKKANVVILNNLNQTVKSYNEVTGFNTGDLIPGIYVVRTHRGEIFRLVVN